MPRLPIDYSNTIIYKLVCKDVSVTDVYVGSTTNFVKRKQLHKCTIINPTNSAYNIYKSQFIRDHGGWENWDMLEICKVSCVDVHEARRIERHHIESLGATLNRNMPGRTYGEWRDDHHEELREKRIQYDQEHREELNEKHRQYCLEHKEELTEKRRQYCLLHKEELAEKNFQYRLAHKEELAEKRRIRQSQKKSSESI